MIGCGIDTPGPAGHHWRPMNRFAAYFYFGFAGFFDPQTGGGLSIRKP